MKSICIKKERILVGNKSIQFNINKYDLSQTLSLFWSRIIIKKSRVVTRVITSLESDLCCNVVVWVLWSTQFQQTKNIVLYSQTWKANSAI